MDVAWDLSFDNVAWVPPRVTFIAWTTKAQYLVLGHHVSEQPCLCLASPVLRWPEYF